MSTAVARRRRLAQEKLTREVTVAGGAFAPDHLGELTQQVPFEIVDAVLADTGAVQARVRDLPSRVVVYLRLAAGLFAEVGYRQVWSRLVAGLDGLAAATPTSSALAQARRRVGVAPLAALFRLLAGPPAGAARWRGLLPCAIDGTTMCVPDSPANLAGFGPPDRHPRRLRISDAAPGGGGRLRHPHPHRRDVRSVPHQRTGLRPPPVRLPTARHAPAGRPQLRRPGPDRPDRRHRSRPAHPLQGRPQAACGRPPPDGSWQTCLGGVTVRVIDAEITVCCDGNRRV